MPNKALIIYDTKYGATEQIANWIAEGLNGADIQHVDDVTTTIYELVIIGSPIYNDMTSKRIIRFLDKNKDTLSSRKIALFTVSVPPDMTEDRSKRFKGAYTLEKLLEHARGTILSTKAFLGKIELKEMTELDRLSLRIDYFLKGYRLRDVNYMDREEAVNWGRHLYDLMVNPPETIPEKPATRQESQKREREK
ncbi:flavodoxin [Methanocella sp. CWC-04]|uniref:Flavodoxin n=1 Tax=Methanooceanicella nereidis TaxID=2052831 RepID=A0AAP2W4V2_9EURY|nr:flavodoxin domain-containing protein [Methanocella sp. CWC-04]MCD1294780.1 flavodoxin [Methanocella sp. CWC-04]